MKRILLCALTYPVVAGFGTIGILWAVGWLAYVATGSRFAYLVSRPYLSSGLHLAPACYVILSGVLFGLILLQALPALSVLRFRGRYDRRSYLKAGFLTGFVFAGSLFALVFIFDPTVGALFYVLTNGVLGGLAFAGAWFVCWFLGVRSNTWFRQPATQLLRDLARAYLRPAAGLLLVLCLGQSIGWVVTAKRDLVSYCLLETTERNLEFFRTIDWCPSRPCVALCPVLWSTLSQAELERFEELWSTCGIVVVEDWSGSLEWDKSPICTEYCLSEIDANNPLWGQVWFIGQHDHGFTFEVTTVNLFGFWVLVAVVS